MRKNYKLLRGLMGIGMIAAVAVIIWQGVELFGQWRTAVDKEILGNYAEYYEFAPNDLFAKEGKQRIEAYTAEKIYARDAKIYTEYLTKWEADPHIEILRLETYTFFAQDNLEVLSYLNPISYDVNWEDFILPVREGRWFEDDKDEVICVSGFSYKVGDVVLLEDSNGQTFEATVVGKTKYPYLLDNYLYMEGKAGNDIENYLRLSDVLLLNPESTHNIKTDLINDGATLLKIDNDIIPEDVALHGTCKSIEEQLIRMAPDYNIPLITMGVSFILFIIFWIAEIIFKRQDKIDNYKVVVLRKQRNNDIDLY